MHECSIQPSSRNSLKLEANNSISDISNCSHMDQHLVFYLSYNLTSGHMFYIWRQHNTMKRMWSLLSEVLGFNLGSIDYWLFDLGYSLDFLNIIFLIYKMIFISQGVRIKWDMPVKSLARCLEHGKHSNNSSIPSTYRWECKVLSPNTEGRKLSCSHPYAPCSIYKSPFLGAFPPDLLDLYRFISVWN